MVSLKGAKRKVEKDTFSAHEAQQLRYNSWVNGVENYMKRSGDSIDVIRQKIKNREIY